MKKLIIVGAGCHGRVVADLVQSAGRYDSVLFLDDRIPEITPQYPIAGKTSDFKKYIPEWEFFTAIGENSLRKMFIKNIIQANGVLATLVHPFSALSPYAGIGRGSVITAGTAVNHNARLGTGVILNTGASVDHDCVIGDFSHICPGAHLAGGVKTGNRVLIGTGASVINNISICSDAIIAAGSVVIENISVPGLYTGIPAKLHRISQ